MGDPPTVHVAPLTTRLTAGVEIGRRGVGWTCFPAGTVHWRDMAFDPGEAARAVAASLAEQGIVADALPPDGEREPERSYVLSGTIQAISIKACSPQYGIGKLFGGGPKAKGQAVLTIGWTYRGPDDAVRANFVTRSDVKISAKNTGDEVFLATALTTAGQDAAKAMKSTISPVR